MWKKTPQLAIKILCVSCSLLVEEWVRLFGGNGDHLQSCKTVAEAACSPQRQINLWALPFASVAMLKSLTYNVNIFRNGIA